MRPILLKGHEGPITKLKYNREGDLMFTCARKDKKPVVWYADNGERLGNYEGHEGAVWDLDVNFDSTQLLTASADRTAKLWDVQTGRELYSFSHKSSVRSCGFAEGSRMALTVQEDNFGAPAAIFIYNLTADVSEQSSEPVRSMFGDTTKINSALWGSLNTSIYSASDDGTVRKWNVETGVEEQKVQAHKAPVRCISFSKDKSMFITASSDHSAKLFDAKNMTCLKEYKSDRPLNSSSISPIMNHIIVGGGQDAMDVTTTSTKVGHFQVDFYHTVYMEYMGHVKGHFGPVNTVSFAPDGKSYASGSEDGYVRLHHFDKEYFNPKYNW
jgi:translation initiation factor 3 subunit I